MNFLDITNPVGKGGVNRRADVMVVQSLLNNVGSNHCGPPAPLKVDGLTGPKTNSAILRFQQGFLSSPDGLISPLGRGGKTIYHLNLNNAISTRLNESKNGPAIAITPSGLNAGSQLAAPVTADPPLPGPVPFFSRKASWQCTAGGTIDVLVGYVAVSGGTLEVKSLKDQRTSSLPFASVGGGYGWSPKIIGQLLEKIFKIRPGNLVDLLGWFENGSSPLARTLWQYYSKLYRGQDFWALVIGWSLKYLGITSSFLAPSTNVGDVYMSNGYVVPDLVRSDFGGGCLILSIGAGVLVGYSGIALLLGFEPDHPNNAALNPKAIAFARGWNYGLSIGAAVTLTAGYVSDIEF